MWKFKQIKPQKARGVLTPEIWIDPNWVAEVKHDGDRRIAQFCWEEGLIRFTGTRESVDGSGYVDKTANLPQLSMHPPRTLDGTVLDGEIIAPHARGLPGGKSKHVTAVMGSLPERAIEFQEKHGWLEYVVFDCLYFKGMDIRGEKLYTRRAYMLEVLSQWKNKFATQAEQIAGAAKEKYFKTLLAQGEEGVVLKSKYHTYGDEKLWVKVKGVWTADVIITGFEPGKGKYQGSVGAIEFGQWVSKGTGMFLRKMGTCRGFTDLLMNSFTQTPKKYIGRVMMITHNGREPTGAFRHPRYKCFRDDKDPKDCVYREGET
jgi:bifunctional non-homologous end joining protein LigD